MSKTNGSSESVFLSLLLIAFIVLRLIPYKSGHIINWSWWWVFSPIWIPLGLIVIMLAIGGFFSYLSYHKELKRSK
jgi:hypothetical protein